MCHMCVVFLSCALLRAVAAHIGVHRARPAYVIRRIVLYPLDPCSCLHLSLSVCPHQLCHRNTHPSTTVFVTRSPHVCPHVCCLPIVFLSCAQLPRTSVYTGPDRHMSPGALFYILWIHAYACSPVYLHFLLRCGVCGLVVNIFFRYIGG